MILYHATLKSNLHSIISKGLLPNLATGAEQVIWLHTAGRREWAILHTTQRHKCEVNEVMILTVKVPRSKLRRRWRGLWTTPQRIPQANRQRAESESPGLPAEELTC